MGLIFLISSVLSCFYLTYGINGGMKANKKDFKYVVSIITGIDNLIHKNFPTLCGLCGGGIIHEKFILTAAHCFADKNTRNFNKMGYYKFEKTEVVVYASVDNVFKPGRNVIKTRGKKVYFIKEFFVTGYDDIAMLELTDGLNLTENKDILYQLALPSRAQPQDNIWYDNAKCLIAGIGKDKTSKFPKYGILKKVYSQIISHSNYRYPDPRKYLTGKSIKTDGSLPDKTQGICDGDSGTPVVLLRSSPLTVIGLAIRTNFQCDGRRENLAEQYIRVSNYVGFIEDIINVTSSMQNATEYKSYNLR